MGNLRPSYKSGRLAVIFEQPARTRRNTSAPSLPDIQTRRYVQPSLNLVASALQAISLRVAITKPTPAHNAALLAKVIPSIGGPIGAHAILLGARDSPREESASQFSYIWLHLMCLSAEICRSSFDDHEAETLGRAFQMLAESISKNCRSKACEAVRLLLLTLDSNNPELEEALAWSNSGQPSDYKAGNGLRTFCRLSRHTIIIHGRIAAMQQFLPEQA